jgi:hypothetical protein
MRTFEAVWQDIKKLQNTDVYTLRHHNKNHIVRVSELELTTNPEKARYPHTHFILKTSFQTVWQKLLANGNIIPVEDGGYHLVCACLALLPEVEYSLNPEAVWLTTNTHQIGRLVKKN